MNSQIYLDYNATTPVDPQVLEKMIPYFSQKFGNAASRTHSFGWVADEAVKMAREQVAGLINCISQEIVFTSGATESVNLAIKGAAEAYRKKGNHFITAVTEHRAVLDTFEALQREGAEVTYLPVSSSGLIDPASLRGAVTERTVLVAIMYANNETGVVQPLKELSEIVHSAGSIFFTDATQAGGKIKIDVAEQHIDLLSLSAHKMYGPKGVGALYVRRKDPRVGLHAQIHGGGHERGLRSGTLNVPGIVGFGEACRVAGEKMTAEALRISGLRDQLEAALLKVSGAYIIGASSPRLPNTIQVCFRGRRAETVIRKLAGVAIATGSACSSALIEPSHVLKAMGFSDEDAYSTLRISLGRFTTEQEISRAAALFEGI